MPATGVVQDALRTTTRRLAAELARPGGEAPGWNEFEWRVAMAVAVMHGISALLAARLRWQGPLAWQAFLAEQAAQGRRREQRIRELLARLDAAARQAGVPLLAMKGSALLHLDLYAPGERPMSDIDLLARPQHAAGAEQLILAGGYAPGLRKRRHIAFEPLRQPADRAFGEHEDNPVKIELHEAVNEALPLREVDITAGLLAPAAAPGLNAYPSPAALMRHLLLHTAGNLCNRSVRLVQLHDLALLAGLLDEAGWQQALAPASDGRPAWWAVPPLALAQRLFPQRFTGVLPGALEAAMAACPRRLCRASAGCELVEVSLSRLGIPLLPGLDWARSPAEALGLAWQRLHPADATTAQMLQGQHSLAGSAWNRLPTWRKALSFLRGAPPRAQTLYSLHRALAYRPASPA